MHCGCQTIGGMLYCFYQKEGGDGVKTRHKHGYTYWIYAALWVFFAIYRFLAFFRDVRPRNNVIDGILIIGYAGLGIYEAVLFFKERKYLK